jgi:endonuclease III
LVFEPGEGLPDVAAHGGGGNQGFGPQAALSSAVVLALLDYGQDQAPTAAGQVAFTPHPEANALIINDPFAFLLAVIFDQGIPAERAWRVPYELMRRLGHLDPARMRADSEGVRTAVAQPPVLHRDLGVSIRDLDGSDIAYDVHVRRVFLRTGLAEYDDLGHMIDVARRAYPERPGAIDMPTWLVGRRWCHAGLPDCPACVLRDVSPKDIDRPTPSAVHDAFYGGPRGDRTASVQDDTGRIKPTRTVGNGRSNGSAAVGGSSGPAGGFAVRTVCTKKPTHNPSELRVRA